MIIALAIGIPAGILSAVRKGSGWDVGANVVALSGISIPNFWLGIMLIMLVSVQLGIAAGFGLHQSAGRPCAQHPDHDHAGLRAGHRHRRDHDAAYPKRHAVVAASRLRQDGPRQGLAGTGGRAARTRSATR